MLFRAPSGYREHLVMLAGPGVWGPRAEGVGGAQAGPERL